MLKAVREQAKVMVRGQAIGQLHNHYIRNECPKVVTGTVDLALYRADVNYGSYTSGINKQSVDNRGGRGKQ